jgi:hypothetical protein
MKYLIAIYTGLLLLGLATSVFYGLVMVSVAGWSGDELHVAGILSVENGFPAADKAMARSCSGPIDSSFKRHTLRPDREWLLERAIRPVPGLRAYSAVPCPAVRDSI